MFVFYNLETTQVKKIINRFKNYEVSISNQPESTKQIITLQNIKNNFNSGDVLKVINDFNLDPKEYGVFLYVSSNDSPLYLELQNRIKEIYKQVGGTLRVSFILDYI